MISDVQPVVIFGTTEFGQVAHAYLSRSGRFDVRAFTVHGRHLAEPTLLGCDVVPFEALPQKFPPGSVSVVLAVGYSRLNGVRTEMYDACKAQGYELLTYVDPGASCTPPVSIGDGCFIFEQNVIQPFVSIGRNVVIWSGNHIGHHAAIGDNCFIASHAVISGRVTIGHNCFVGVSATIRDGVTVAPNCIIGAGAVILRDTAEGEVYRVEGTSPSPHRSGRWKL